jgi:hypothetical protein
MEGTMRRLMKMMMITVVVVFGAWAVAWAQETPQDSTTGEAAVPEGGESDREAPLTEVEQQELKERTGTTYRSWSELLEDWLTPRPVAKDTIVRIDEKYALPHVAVPFKMEIVKEDEDTVWLRGIPPEDPDSAIHEMWLRREYEQMAYTATRDWQEKYGEAEYFVDFSAEIVPPPFMDALELEEVRSGLPARGLWQMNFALADMNGDGVTDLVAPPSRKGTGSPSVFLGGGDGTFAPWKGLQWSGNVPYDYGSVAVADFNLDGHQDIVLAIHFKGQYVLYGAGDGNFMRSELLPSPDPRVTSRAVSVADVDSNGRVDIAFISELDYDLSTSQRIEDATSVWTVLNTESGWVVEHQGLPLSVISDNLEMTDVDGDGRPDLVLASNATAWRRLVYLNRGEDGWDGPLQRGVLSAARHPDVATGPAKGGRDVYATFSQFSRPGGQTVARTGIVRYQVGAGGVNESGVVLLMDDQRYDPWFRLAAGDLNGDGRTDVVAGRKGGTVEAFIGTDTGELFREDSPELESRGCAYDIQLADLDGDGLDDIIIGFASEAAGGGFGVWLTRKK